MILGKWLANVIGLLNHREFAMMLFGLMLISVLGIVLDLWLAVLIAEKAYGPRKHGFSIMDFNGFPWFSMVFNGFSSLKLRLLSFDVSFRHCF